MSVCDPEGRPVVNNPNEALRELLEEYDSYRMYATLAFSPRRKRLALEAKEHTLRECANAISCERTAGHADLATEWRKIAEFVRTQRHELRMWLALNENRMHTGWNALVEARDGAERAARWLPAFGPAQDINRCLNESQRLLFPKQRFFSPGLRVKEKDVECTLCGARGGNCDHIPGNIYAGEVAGSQLHAVEIQELSIVDNPANRRARIFSCGGIDTLTGESFISMAETNGE